jgi:hypothetical protein
VQGPADARPLLTRGGEIVSPLITSGRTARSARGLQSEALWYLARIDRALNRPADAVRADGEAAGLWKGRPAARLAELALKEVGQAALIGYGKTKVSAKAQGVKNLDLDLAAGHLRMAVSNGFTDLKLLEANPDFGVLMTHPALKTLVDGLGYRGGVSQPKN